MCFPKLHLQFAVCLFSFCFSVSFFVSFLFSLFWDFCFVQRPEAWAKLYTPPPPPFGQKAFLMRREGGVYILMPPASDILFPYKSPSRRPHPDPAQHPEIKIFGVGRSRGLLGCGGVGIVREKENHYPCGRNAIPPSFIQPSLEGCFQGCGWWECINF